MRKRDLLSAAAGALVATVLAGGIAFAAIPSAGGVINGCYQKNEGQLRVIDPGARSCHPSEVAIAWNEQGVKGDKGDKGDSGPPGKDGVDGRDGMSIIVEQEAPGANCPAGGARLTAANGVAYVCNASTTQPVCGNGIREGSEECDDGNSQGFDGCNQVCRIEGDGGGD